MSMEPIITVTGDQLEEILETLSKSYADGSIYSLSFAIGEGGIKLKPNNWSWTRPLGKVAE